MAVANKTAKKESTMVEASGFRDTYGAPTRTSPKVKAFIHAKTNIKQSVKSKHVKTMFVAHSDQKHILFETLGTLEANKSKV